MVYTAPSAANGQWGNITYNNPQKIMDGYVAAYKNDQELGQDWVEDFTRYGNAVHKSHEKLGNKIGQAWEQHGEKAHQYAQQVGSDIRNIHAAQNP